MRFLLKWGSLKNKKTGATKLVLSYKCLKLKLRVFLAGCTVAMVTYCAAELAPTCSLMIGQLFDHQVI